ASVTVINIVIRMMTPGVQPVQLAYIILYSLLLIITICMFLFIDKQQTHLVTKQQNIIQVYIGTVVIISSLITYYDILFYNHILIFVVVYSLCNLLFIPILWFSIPSSLLSVLILYLGLQKANVLGFSNVHYLFFVINLFMIGLLLQKYVGRTQQQIICKLVQLEEANRLLHEMAHKDPLTGLPNRNAYYAYIEKLLSDEQPIQCQMYVIDIDYFKQFNDYYGHPAGDEVLAKVAKSLQAVEGIFFVRWGGEEFLGIGTSLEVEMSEKVEEIMQLVKSLAITNVTAPKSGIVSISIGAIYEFVRTKEDIKEHYKLADKALYQSKQKGRNQYTIIQRSR
ncbi:MAG: GGDEF domain-containing protein, partial [Lysinibacillus sp.]